MGYDTLYHHGSTNMVSVREIYGGFVFLFSLVYHPLGAFLLKKIIPIVLLGSEMIIANLTLRASLNIYHLISNARSWNNG